MTFQIVHPDRLEEIHNQPGFVPAAQYGLMVPMDGEIGSVDGIRFVAGFEERTEFVTDAEFALAKGQPNFVRGSKISGRIGAMTYICLAPGEL